jgi:hypothetical protein
MRDDKGANPQQRRHSEDFFSYPLSPILSIGCSYSLKAKISENVGIFVLALKRKNMVIFALFA